MKLWIDDARPAPNRAEYITVDTVCEAKDMIILFELRGQNFDIIDIDHDAGEYAKFGGDYISSIVFLHCIINPFFRTILQLPFHAFL